MLAPRLIPCLLLDRNKLVKTIQFSNPRYIGDPINAIKIFNEKEVDELIILDITATRESKKPNFDLIKRCASECFMPMCYGGGITSIQDIETLFKIGIEKISLGNQIYIDDTIIKIASDEFGSQSIVVSIDAFKENNIYINKRLSGMLSTQHNTVTFSKTVENLGAGEILLTSINNEGSMDGFDLDLIKQVSSNVSIPVIAHGGASSINDIVIAL